MCLALSYTYVSITALRARGFLYQKRRGSMRKIIVALIIAAALVVSGVSVTTFSAGQLTSSVWAEDGSE